MTTTTTSTGKPTTHAQAYAEAAERVKQVICKLLYWDEMTYAEYQYTTGIAYLHWYLPCDDKARRQLEGSKLFWNWWKQQWNEDDYIYKSTSGIGLMSLMNRRIIYEDLHCPRALAVQVKPNEIVLSEIKP